MPKYHVIVQDVSTYDFIVTVPDGLDEDDQHEFIMDYLGDNRDECWRSGEEAIVAMDEVP